MLDYDQVCSIAVQILEQKAICQQDPDQDADEEAPEDQAEYDSVLISSAGDLVAAMANALGADFTTAFASFFPLISKYYVRKFTALMVFTPHAFCRKKVGPSVTVPQPSGAWPRSSPA